VKVNTPLLELFQLQFTPRFLRTLLQAVNENLQIFWDTATTSGKRYLKELSYDHLVSWFGMFILLAQLYSPSSLSESKNWSKLSPVVGAGKVPFGYKRYLAIKRAMCLGTLTIDALVEEFNNACANIWEPGFPVAYDESLESYQISAE